jgi:hypothetical protein
MFAKFSQNIMWKGVLFWKQSIYQFQIGVIKSFTLSRYSHKNKDKAININTNDTNNEINTKNNINNNNNHSCRNTANKTNKNNINNNNESKK